MIGFFVLGRLLVGWFYLENARHHFLNSSSMAKFAAAKGVPFTRAAVLGSGLLLLIGGISLLTGFMPLVGIAAVAVFLAPVTLVMHNFWAIKDPQMRAVQRVQFSKNFALLGSALMLTAIPIPWALSLGR